jgi:hypothetical protein
MIMENHLLKNPSYLYISDFMNMRKKIFGFVLTALFLCPVIFALASDTPLSVQDSSSSHSKGKEVRRYIRPTFFLNTFRTSPSKLKNSRLTYNFAQTDLGFYMPLYTNTSLNESDQTYATFHLLLTGNFLVARPEIELRKTVLAPKLFRPGIGLRGIYANGRKNTWFFDMSPFVAQDGYTLNNPTLRFASVLLFNRTVSSNFSYRIGILKTFIFGGALPLPIFGMRFGPLDGVYLSIHLPRNIALHFPLGQHFEGNLFFKPSGGIYNFNTKDTLPVGKISIEQFRRVEYQTGFQLGYSSGSKFSMYLGTGFVSNRQIALVSSRKAFTLKNISWARAENGMFLNFGVTLKFGEAKRVVNNIQMYDVFDLNNSYEPIDNNAISPNPDIPRKNNKAGENLNNLQYKDVQDLFETNDLY